MQKQHLYRIVLALLVVGFSSASAVHDAVHHAANADHRSAIGAPSAHDDASGDCQFCAKGPSVSTGHLSVDLACFTQVQLVLQSTAQDPYGQSLPSTESPRGPPQA